MSLSSNTFSSSVAVIGGSGFYRLSESSTSKPFVHEIKTPYGSESVRLYGEQIGTKSVWFIPRHGQEHAIAPHKINYRANLWALKKVGVKQIVAVNAVGGITQTMSPGSLCLPDQILDYSWGREHTYFDGSDTLDESFFDNHIDFSWPYNKSLGLMLAQAAQDLGIKLSNSGTYACMQGPRLETAAEVRKLKNDGADIVGMTGMPEAALARELGIDYSCVALVVNWGAGLTESVISLEEIKQVLADGVDDIRRILLKALSNIT